MLLYLIIITVNLFYVLVSLVKTMLNT